MRRQYYRCRCFLTNNYFLADYKIHVKYYGNNDNRDDRDFWTRFGDQLAALGCTTDQQRQAVSRLLRTEFDRRLNLDQQTVQRIQFIRDNYRPKHPDIYRLSVDYLCKSFVDLVDQCKRGDQLSEILPHIRTVSRERRVYQFDVFTTEFCDKFIDECDHFNGSPMPKTRPNTMNNYGILLNELGFDEHFLTPLRVDYLNPLAKVFFPDWIGSDGSGDGTSDGLDSHRAFTIKYSLNEDRDLFTHYDNSEVTLNVCLGKQFTGSEVYFGSFRTEHQQRHTDHTSITAPVVHSPGVGLFHLGQQMHGSMPITDGQRQNLVIWMRASTVRNQLCPMCDTKPEPLLSTGFGDGFTID
ncbi:2-oxoglutarate and iron-dependent oxygenase domain-containing protein 2-like [Oppia nitens]|uniref:2-oxoglutarate and iron-dependent oxygenase domain-containing protein 2-like n=1 Tax=Oppia nitens TaxID=1686743 RepID=UPI0023DB235E|nr:2-oxoglutarate and iron-dependent oxygenase domain-containing protein 2-like [Oppia nitens]